MLRRLAAELVALIAPPACAACRAPLAAGDEVVCPGCRGALPWLPRARCPRCALPAPCGRCPARRLAFDAAWAPLAYAGSAQSLVAALKFRGALPVADAMAAAMLATAPVALLDAVVVPVPPHPGRARRRGFDPAERLAQALARRAGLPLARVLRRRGGAARQLGSTRDARLAAPLDVQATTRAPGRALLVDDVHTTGATLDACARALRAAGAERVAALTYARTLRTGVQSA